MSPPSYTLTPADLKELGCVVRGNVRADPITRAAYANDASIYQMTPCAVIEPLDRDDAVAALRWCDQKQYPVLPRGGGTSLVGQTVTTGVVIDTTRHLNQILEINTEERWVRVQPGVVRDELNRALTPYALHFAPDPATTSRATIGGMISNNSAGMRSIQYGMTIDHVLNLELALADGEVITLGPIHSADEMSSPRARDIATRLLDLIARHTTEIAARFPRVSRRVGGYALDALLGEPPWNLAKLIAGSEGTLGMILSARVNLEPLPSRSGLCLAHFAGIPDCLRSVQDIVGCGASAVELLDGIILKQAREHPMTAHTCEMLDGTPEAILVIEARSNHAAELEQQLLTLQKTALGHGAYAAPVIEAPDAVADVWLMRESALGLMTTVPGDRKPIPYIEDAAVPLQVLPAYVADVQRVCADFGQPVSLFAHAGAGLLHIRPLHNLRDPTDREQLQRIQDAVFDLVVQYGGSWSGEHGDGMIRAAYNRRFFGDELYQAFHEVKNLFDPNHRMNPGKILDVPDRLAHLRVDAGGPMPALHTGFRWEQEQGWLKATEQCTGIGACRQLKTGVMCPSYMALRDELHSTRGRANILRLTLSGELGPDAIQSHDLHKALDLCLACKGCYSECPNRVDVGKMKAEYLHQYHQHHPRMLRDRLFGHLSRWGSWATGPQARVVNGLLKHPLLRRVLDKSMGIDSRQPLPEFTTQRFTHWFRKHRQQHPKTGIREVLLFTDIYTELHQPQIGRAAVAVLEALDYAVDITPPMDSQRAALSKGMLTQAARHGIKMLETLLALAGDHRPILVLEPSCATALQQDLVDLVTPAETARRIAGRTRYWDQFLWSELSSGHLQWPESIRPCGDVFVHVHCHQRAIDGGRSTIEVLRSLPHSVVHVSPAGCCGMAGSFGYEREHYDLSVQIAADRLLPALQQYPADTAMVAPGFSCRHQIMNLSHRTAVHSAEYLARFFGMSGCPPN